MSIELEIGRIQTARNKIRTKLNTMGLAQATSTIDECASAVESIKDNGAVSAQIKEGDTYTIPKGYHNGSGTVSGVKGGGDYNLQSKTAVPTKSQQNVTPDVGYYGLSDVTVEAIPENFNDTSSVTATADDVLANKVIINSLGQTVAGKMPNNGAVSKTLDTTSTSYTIPKGYHSGTGSVKLVVEEKVATPSKIEQSIVPTEGKVISKVTVASIPSEYQNVSEVNAIASDVLDQKVIVDAAGRKVTGTMPNNGAVSATIDGLTTLQHTISAGYTSGGTVKLSNDIENKLKEI